MPAGFLLPRFNSKRDDTSFKSFISIAEKSAARRPLQHHIHTQKLLSSNTVCTVYIWWPGTPRWVLTPSSLTDGPVGVCSCRVAEKEPVNKMSLHNLATVFGPTLLRPSESESTKGQHITSASDIWSHDVMAQVPTHSRFVQCVFIICRIVALIFCVCETQSAFIPRSENLINRNWGFRLWADAVNGRLVCPLHISSVAAQSFSRWISLPRRQVTHVTAVYSPSCI